MRLPATVDISLSRCISAPVNHVALRYWRVAGLVARQGFGGSHATVYLNEASASGYVGGVIHSFVGACEDEHLRNCILRIVEATAGSRQER